MRNKGQLNGMNKVNVPPFGNVAQKMFGYTENTNILIVEELELNSERTVHSIHN